jgi:hypothetical protein
MDAGWKVSLRKVKVRRSLVAGRAGWNGRLCYVGKRAGFLCNLDDLLDEGMLQELECFYYSRSNYIIAIFAVTL